MATTVATKSSSGGWSKLFPTELGTEVYSLIFAKKLFAVAVSYVIYMRHLFPASAFFDKQLEGVRLKILREDNKFPGSSKVVYWLRGCFDAIDRQYLKSAVISLYTLPEGAPDATSASGDANEFNVIESYSFKLSYTQKSVSVSVQSSKEPQLTKECELSAHSKEQIKLSTISLLKAIQTAGQKLQALPADLFMTMRLQYYEDVTPEGYVPPGFKEANNVNFHFHGDPVNVRIGTVQTLYHSLKMHIQTKRSFIPGQKIARPSDQSLNTSQSSVELPNEMAQSMEVEDSQMQAEEISDSLQKQTLQSDGDQSETFDVRCPCGVNKDDGVMILCDGCGLWQHAVCFRILEETDVPASHICELCTEEKPELLVKGGITDESLKNMAEEARKSLCLFRRAVLLCTSTDSLSPSAIAKDLEVEYTVARGIFNRLVKEGILKEAGQKRGEKLVQREYLESTVFQKVFERPSSDQEVVATDGKSVSAVVSPKSVSSVSTSVRRTPRRALEEHNSESYNSETLIVASQDSVTSPLPSKRQKRTGIANTPVAIYRK